MRFSGGVCSGNTFFCGVLSKAADGGMKGKHSRVIGGHQGSSGVIRGHQGSLLYIRLKHISIQINIGSSSQSGEAANGQQGDVETSRPDCRKPQSGSEIQTLKCFSSCLCGTSGLPVVDPPH